MSCPFCNIAAKEVQRVIYEGQTVVVILSNPRLMFGHTLVIPKRHVEKLSALNAEERRDLFNTAIAFQEKIMNKFASGCDLTQHCRPFLPEGRTKVNHVHLHLQPRELNDELFKKVQSHQGELFIDLPDEEVTKFKTLLAE